MVYLNTNNFWFKPKVSSQSIVADKLALFEEPLPVFAFIEKMDSLFSLTEELKAELTEKANALCLLR